MNAQRRTSRSFFGPVFRLTPVNPPLVRGEALSGALHATVERRMHEQGSAPSRLRLGKTVMKPLAALLAALLLSGCAVNNTDTHYEGWRLEGKQAMARGDYAVARSLFLGAEYKRHRQPEVLNALGTCSVMLAQERLDDLNYAAAMRELDLAEGYFRRAIDTAPAYQPAHEGLNQTLELKGEYAAALKQAEWSAENVGPSAKQSIFLARELEKRGDMDAALLRYRQAVAMEPQNPRPHVALGVFYKKLGDRKEALAEFQAAQQLNPRDQYVMDQVADLTAAPRQPAPRSSAPRFAAGAGNRPSTP